MSVSASTMQMCKMSLQLKSGVARPLPQHIYTYRHESYIYLTFPPFHCEDSATPHTVNRAWTNGWGCLWAWASSKIRKKRGLKKRRLHVSTCGQSQSLHSEPYPAAPQKLFHVQQVDSQSGLQLLTHSLWAPAVCAVHGHTQAWHQQEQAGEEGKVGAGRCRLIGWIKEKTFCHHFDL